MNYIQNKGQWDEKIFYKSSFHGGFIFLEKSTFTFLFYENDLPDKIHHSLNSPSEADTAMARFHAIKLSFKGTLQTHSLAQENIQSFYHNYFIGNDRKKWASNVAVCQSVIYKNIYNAIDIKVFGRGDNVRYDFILAPGANPSDIQMEFSGQDKLFLQNGKLIISTSVGNVQQEAPYAYQETKNGIVKVECHYVIYKNSIRLSVGNYDKSKLLIIDPTIVFSTYTGSTGENWGATATYDMAGNGYTAGQCFAPGYPVTQGAFQSHFVGLGTAADISISKFNPMGSQMLFSTYLGGNQTDGPHSITVDKDDNLIVFGRTYSSDFPVASLCYDHTLGGACDMTLTRFNALGTALLGSTYIGGSAVDGQNAGNLNRNFGDLARGAVHVDDNNEIYVASCTSSTDFPVTQGCFQNALSGNQDACIFKMNVALTHLLFSTYLGGSLSDAAYNFSFDSKNTIYITGGTESSNFPVTLGTLHSSAIGNIDGFVAHLSLSGNALLSSSFIGTTSYDQSYFIQMDKRDNVYLYGQSEGNYPITQNIYSNPHSGQFIHKLDPTLSITLLSSQFGSQQIKPDLSPSAFFVDNCHNIYVSGWGGALLQQDVNATMSGMPISSDAYQATTDNNDFYFAVFTSDMDALYYGTYFGGAASHEHVDGGTSCYDKSGVMYQAICASCGGHNDLPTTSGVWANVNGSSDCNNALVKFKMNLNPTVAQIVLQPFTKNGCVPFTPNIINKSINASSYLWDFGDGFTSGAIAPVHTYTSTGTFTVTLIAHNPSSCNTSDTSSFVMDIRSPMIVANVPSYTICKSDTVQLQINAPGATSFSWFPSITLSDSTIAEPIARPDTSIVYSVIAKDSICNITVTKTLQVTVQENTTRITSDQTGLCMNDTVKLALTRSYTHYLWNNGQTSSFINVHVPGLYTIFTTDTFGCKGMDSIRMREFEIAMINSYSIALCKGQSVQLFSPEGSYKYKWSPSYFLSGDTIFNPIVKPDSTTKYTITISNDGCKNSGHYNVFVNPIPNLNLSQKTITAIYGEPVHLSASSDTTCYWYPSQGLSCDSCKTTIATPENSTLYTCRVTNKFGCINASSVLVEIVPTFYVPNTFTPNNDGLNDTFMPLFTGFKKIAVTVYDRWGNQIYTYSNSDGGWNGTYNGTDCKQDVYVYQIDATDHMNKRLQKTGQVTLIR